MKISLNASVNGRRSNRTVGIDVPELLLEAFEPVRTADDALMCIGNGEMKAGSYSVNKVIKIREDAAEILSSAITQLLLSEMATNDTHNGY